MPGSQPEEQVKKDAGDPAPSIIRAKEIDVSSNEGVGGSGFVTKLACEGVNGIRLVDVSTLVEVVTGDAKDGKIACDDIMLGLGVWREELGVENGELETSFKLS
jgi:hypothetical protein